MDYLNNVKYDEKTRLVLPICPHCNDVILESDSQDEYTMNISQQNLQGETYLYHKECLNSIFHDILEDQSFQYGEEREEE